MLIASFASVFLPLYRTPSEKALLIDGRDESPPLCLCVSSFCLLKKKGTREEKEEQGRYADL
ncbi:hypothetical protein KSX_81270 [Ktedonospora formicarum]|uniref:Uncharacterized protein n=1 Tax=Ktedonospora formicarum TaxID=2778364 RepID=A0A8J3I5J2_9CHLR|nr:hypothetical protein KSX_81270 [Ktedonospora formicarum]